MRTYYNFCEGRKDKIYDQVIYRHAHPHYFIIPLMHIGLCKQGAPELSLSAFGINLRGPKTSLTRF